MQLSGGVGVEKKDEEVRSYTGDEISVLACSQASLILTACSDSVLIHRRSISFVFENLSSVIFRSCKGLCWK
jgi:hypothetical protein